LADHFFLLLPPAAILSFLSSQTSFTVYFRYALPCFPFLVIWASGAAGKLALRSKKRALVAAAALSWSVMSSLWVYPHSGSYFNELAGGPKEGHYYLVDTNIDAGQDLFYLKGWLDRHPEASELPASCFTSLELRHFGMRSPSPPPGPREGVEPIHPRGDEARGEPLPGWYAVSAHNLRREGHPYSYFLRFRPVAMAGYSIYIYHLTREDVNCVRADLKLPQLPER
jgi:hypothetical protein